MLRLPYGPALTTVRDHSEDHCLDLCAIYLEPIWKLYLTPFLHYGQVHAYL